MDMPIIKYQPIDGAIYFWFVKKKVFLKKNISTRKIKFNDLLSKHLSTNL
ncbi:hypothetical protein FEM08_07950 [Flavobacterium gilvum]|nr:hypothetical protein FEM08_07950 [Flavobacterium gilvum]